MPDDLVERENTCRVCDGGLWVCENHMDRPWDGTSSRGDACSCGGAGAPCGSCNLEMASAGYVDIATKQLTAERDALAAQCEALVGALGGIFAHFDRINTFSERGNAPGHGHYLPGIWDLDNEPGKAGKPCEWCATWSTARAVIQKDVP